jgi:S-adenosyl-L-methionine hydrolase (adenosine-forming)
LAALITLLTDFGLADTYVGQMKGAILSVAPLLNLVDLTHAVPPQDVQAGAFLLWCAVEAFPAGTIHIAVVDPGVGSNRRSIALRAARGDYFVGPDNGLLMPAVDHLGGRTQAVELTKTEFWRSQPTGTFDGRDVFGPVAGHLANGIPLTQLGRNITDPLPLSLPVPHGLEGEVMHVDAYGNLITNLTAASLPPTYIVRLGAVQIPQAVNYAQVDEGTLLALVGSAGLLEISARNASADALTGAGRGTPVSVVPT